MMLVLLLTTGCHNACQQLCKDMADYAKNQCDLQFSPEDIDNCYKEQRRGNLQDDLTVADCKDAAPQLEQEWSCDDVADYFDNPPEAGDSAQ
jgi:hypothetical protein